MNPVSDEMAVTKVVEHGDASDLPELDWFWRRVYVFALTIACCLFIWLVARRVEDVATLREAIRNAMGIIVLLNILYLAGASAEKIVQLVSAVRTTRKETVMSAPPPATATKTSVTTDASAPNAPPWERKP